MCLAVNLFDCGSDKYIVFDNCWCCFWQKFEKKYNSELAKGAVSKDTKFEYAWCLIRSKYTEDIKKGIVLLEGKTKMYGHVWFVIQSQTSQIPTVNCIDNWKINHIFVINPKEK